ncbi:glycosyltransferase involved in cell wall biosynthesis [Microbacterium terrae]|uniref:D-inositol 3-phosphate glycosyltransferase n=1 Tax=Microbacterium terrae TaxID=69369 RepID=A0A0M2HER0_9MICO|nr:glycosyltransferase family 4 protein [Microbacterium terrae]KJL42712.1 GDP-mannose-dependent alpha-(1-2)-phosphatidylinositol mannosyltransferase [Microbacterium terrae]MBP1078575.1 glycosyltransferase involved in cell wall biosynthesis [Microbacterium terrae]GLJ97975.1 LPS biosynthesis RfbU related protein [Microbacterium terrae]
MATPAEPSLRIAMISYYLPSGSKIGVGYQAHELANELVRRGHHVSLFSECPPVDGAEYEHRQVHLPGSLRTFRFAWALRRVDFSSYDVIHAHGDDYWLWRRRTPMHIRTMHGSSFEEAGRVPGLWEKLRMLLLGFSEILATIVADRTVAVSPATRRWTPWVRHVIPNGVDTSRFRPDASKRADAPTVLFVGTWRNRKRGRDLAAAFQRDILPVLPSARLEMVCRDAPDDPGPGVVVLGELTDAELVAAYQRAWVFCLPSDYEGFGIPYAEAMASGLPIVATPNIGARYVTDEGRAGVLSELGSIGGELLRVLTDDGVRTGLEDRSRARSQEFALSSVVDMYMAAYRR